MKLFSVAIVAAFLCISAVSSSPRLPTGKDMETYFEQSECSIGVMAEVIGVSELMEDFRKFASTANRILTVDKEKCYKAKNRDHLQECLLPAFITLLTSHDDFLGIVHVKNVKLEKELTAKVKSQCSGHNAIKLFSEMDNMSDVLLKRFQCYEKVMGEATVSQNMEESWSVYQPLLKHELENWGNCANAENKVAVTRCNIDKMTATQNILNEYIRSMLSSNTEVINYYMRAIQSKCNQHSLYDSINPESSTVNYRIRYYKCLGDAMSKAWITHGYNETSSKYQRQLQIQFDNWKKCLNAGNSDAIESCSEKQKRDTLEVLKESATEMVDIDGEIMYDYYRFSRHCSRIH